MNELYFRVPDDFHVHVRRGTLMREVLPGTVAQFGRALIMPNTNPGIFTGPAASFYRHEIELVMRDYMLNSFTPLMSIKLTDATTPAVILEAREAGVVAGKVYPVGVTTNSDDGVSDLRVLVKSGVLAAMQECGMLLLIHGEKPGAFCLDREREYLADVEEVAEQYPNLRIVLEHVSTRAAVEKVKQLGPNVAATITAHHMLLTLDDVVGDKLMPHNFCKPIAKRPNDRDAVLAAAISGNPKFFYGSDDAPHHADSKECDCGAAGVYVGPFRLALLATIFERHGALDKLENFWSVYGARHYRLPLNEGRVRLLRQRREIPEFLPRGTVKTFRHLKFLDWEFAGKQSS